MSLSGVLEGLSSPVVAVIFLVGMVFIIKGGDWFVDAASWFAEISGIPKLIVGATVVSVATTLPEMLVSMFAASAGSVDMATGNAVGSVTANIGLIMALSLICIPAAIKRRDYLFKSVLMLTSAVIMVICGILGEVVLPVSILLLIMCGAFFFENVAAAKKALVSAPADRADEKPNGRTVVINIVKFIIGVAGIVVGAQVLVDGGTVIATRLGVSERIIGVTMVAVGTSLPELVTTVTAIIKKQSSLSVGNIIGANILDMTLIMPLAAMVTGKNLPIARSAAVIDLPACLIVGAVAVVPALINGKFSRWQGILLITVYVAYVVITCIS